MARRELYTAALNMSDSYFRGVVGCSTVKQVEAYDHRVIALLATNLKTSRKYHVEVQVDVGNSIKAEETYTYEQGVRFPNRDGLDFYNGQIFEYVHVKSKMREIFGDVPYQKVLVAWAIDDDSVVSLAKSKYDIEIYFVKEMFKQLLLERRPDATKSASDLAERWLRMGLEFAKLEKEGLKRRTELRRKLAQEMKRRGERIIGL